MINEYFHFEIGPFVDLILVEFHLLIDEYPLELNLDIHLANTRLVDVHVRLSFVTLEIKTSSVIGKISDIDLLTDLMNESFAPTLHTPITKFGST